MKKTMMTILASGAALVAMPALAQDATTAEQPAAEAAAPELTREQIEENNRFVERYNGAVQQFNKAQTEYDAKNYAASIATLDAALPIIRESVQREPANVGYIGFLAGALSLQADSKAASGDLAGFASLYEESLPLWHKMMDAKPADTALREKYLGILLNLGNYNLSETKDNAKAKTYFEESLEVAKAARATDPNAAVPANAELSSLVGLLYATRDTTLLEQIRPVAQELRDKGVVNEANTPIVAKVLGG